MKLKLVTLAASVLVSGAVACTTTGNNTRQNQTLSDKGRDKPGEKGQGPAPVVAPTTATPTNVDPSTTEAPTTAPVAREPSADEQLAFVKTHTSPTSDYGEPERNFVAALPANPKPGSITEAAVALGLVKTVLHPRHLDAVTFKETDIAAGDQGDDVKSPTLEQLARERGVNLPDALVENPLLRGYGIAKQVHQALSMSGGSPDFKTEITLALKREASLWSEFGTTLSAPEPTTASTEEPIDDAAPPNPADLRGGDAVLGEAQALADRGNFLAAIRKAASISEASPMHPMAQEKVKEFSKTAVQELRKKAANAFQSAAPVTDSRTKASYLKQAKTFLEEAIKNYPEAPQLPTVRDNLRAISRDLERLETEPGKGH